MLCFLGVQLVLCWGLTFCGVLLRSRCDLISLLPSRNSSGVPLPGCAGARSGESVAINFRGFKKSPRRRMALGPSKLLTRVFGSGSAGSRAQKI